MKSNFTTRQLKDQLIKLELAIKWLEQLGIQYNPSRIIIYKKHLEQLMDAIEKKEVSKLLLTHNDFVLMNSIFEINTLNSVFNGLQMVSPTKGLIYRLNDMMLGPSYVKNETNKPSSHKGRDTSFELLLASFFERAGYELNFETDADLVAEKEEILYVVECKRPRDRKSLKNIINKADKQLSKRYKDFPRKNLYGILAVSIDLVVNPENRYLFVSNPELIETVISKEVKSFISTNQYLWQPPRNQKTIGMLGLFRTVAVIESPSVITNCNYMVGNNSHQPDTVETKLLRNISKDLESVILQGKINTD